MELFVEIGVFIITDLLCVFLIIFYLFPKFFPKQQYIQLFITTILVITLVGVIFINALCTFATCNVEPFTWKSTYVGFFSILESFSTVALLLIGKKLYEAQYQFLQLEKAKKESELLLLKSQIDPHFLFNNLNTVDALIDSNPKAAKDYLNRLGQLYRYLVANKDFEVVPLEEELEFAKNYMYLMERRYGTAYQFEIEEATDVVEKQLIPPGALQTLLENVVKHNQASATEPVVVHLLVDDKNIIVKNVIRKKFKLEETTGTGLNNLKSRYKLLTDRPIQFQSNGEFIVTLPSINQVD
jgi:LytS/YehU family sensor histidine kinase